jgi:flagellar biosynthesis protein FlhF
MVKATLGVDAIILSTRDVSNGLFRPKEIEVTAALPDSAISARATQAQAFAPNAASAGHQKQENAGGTAPSPRTTTELAQPAQAKGASSRHRASEDVSEELTRLRSTLEDMRREMRSVTGQVKLERELALPPAGAECLAHLIDRGVDEHLAKEILRQAVETAPNTNTATILAAVRQALASRILTERAPWIPEDRKRIVALVGPTGVGKTTTLAKIAARAIMEWKQKVALITIDTYRVGASEQVMRYGEIMSVPTYVARDRLELTQAIERCVQADLVLVDTAGRSVSEAVARQAEVLRSIDDIELHLVMSACSGSREMAAAADRYRPLNPERVIITKVDEAVGPGSLLTAAIRTARPIIAVTDGQRVPEDIHSLSVAELVDLVIGDFSSKTSSAGVKVGGC